MSGVDSIWFAEALIRLHASHDGCWVRLSFDKAVECHQEDVFDLCLVGLR